MSFGGAVERTGAASFLPSGGAKLGFNCSDPSFTEAILWPATDPLKLIA